MNKLSSSGNLCFKEDEFLDPNFSVDKFVTRCKDLVTMNTLREDLETHYKNIQLALIELINRDYADFVSLSSNLIGTEKTIENLSLPLGQLKEEVNSVKEDIVDALSKLEKKLAQRKLIRDKKTRLHHLINVIHSVEKIEKILTADPKSPDMEIFMNEDSHPGHFLERIAGEFNQLQFYVLQSKGHPIIESIRPRVSLITSKLQENLESTFEQGIARKQQDLILRCLRTYALIDKVSHAEELFRHLVVKPFTEDVINDQYHSEHGTKALCDQILRFIDENCNILLELTSDELQKRKELVYDTKEQTVKGFDFLVNSVWVELAQALEEKLPLLFSPGNPDLFLKRYKVMMNFVQDFENHCTSAASFNHLRKHESYHSFMIKWSLPVYFQIRFQEIGSKIEMCVDVPFEPSPSELFMTNIFGCCWLGVLQCWSNEVYVPALNGRFWKLTLQIISRLTIFLKSVVQPEEKLAKETSIEQLTLLLADLVYFIKKITDIFEEQITICLCLHNTSVNIGLCKEALNSSCDSLNDSLTLLQRNIVSRLSNEGSSQLENVKNVPRLYRRTNRDLPTQPSPYVGVAFQPLVEFKVNSNTLEMDRQLAIIKEAVDEITTNYYTTVSELLTSIKKTEDSLQRLKQQRKVAAGGQTAVTTTTKTNETSDENKIRKQIHLDVLEYENQISTLGLTAGDFQTFLLLKDISEKSVNTTRTEAE